MTKARCSHCKSWFLPVRSGHIFCSPTCRKLSFKAGKRKEADRRRRQRLDHKLKKLAASPFGRYLASEVRRAGTVEVLHGHTLESMRELVDLRRRCTLASGYEDGTPTGHYELSHIWPVAHPDRLGLLHPLNLVIATKSFNRRHGRGTPHETKGCFKDRTLIDPRWAISHQSKEKILKICRKYVGKDFDKWLGSHVITLTQRQSIIKKLKTIGYSAEYLESLSLDRLKDVSEDEEISYYSRNKNPEHLASVMTAELSRAGDKGVLAEVSAAIYEDSYAFDGYGELCFLGPDERRQDWIDFVLEQCQLLLHGLPYSDTWEGRPVTDWMESKDSPPAVHQYIYRQSVPNPLDDDMTF